MIERRLEVAGLRFAVAEAGGGGRPLLIVHGFTGAKEDFTPWLDQLAVLGFHAVAFDHRGHGASSHPPDPLDYSLATMADDVIALADAFGWERFALLGHSMGGMVAQLVALGNPDRVDALVLMDTGPGPVKGLSPELVAIGADMVRTGGMAAYLEAGRDNPDEAPAARALREADPDYAAWNDAKLLGSAPAMFLGIVPEFVNQPDRLAALARLPMPTLVIVGEQDDAFVGDSEKMAATIPGAALAVISGAAHCPQFEAGEAWWQALALFLTGSPPPPE